MNLTRDLPRFVQDLLAAVPPAGQGVNSWLFRVARVLHAFRGTLEIESLLEAATKGCGRAVTPAEIRRAVERSWSCAWIPGQKSDQSPTTGHRWPAINFEAVEQIVRDGPHLADLWELSPVRIENDSAAEDLVDLLFPGDPLLCIGSNIRTFGCKPRSQWRGQLSGLSLLVPSAMTAPTGITQDGRTSAHTLSNTGPRQHLVVEFDITATSRDGALETRWAPLVRQWSSAGISIADGCAALALHLAEFRDPVLVCSSGGKSLHTWFPCDGESDNDLEPFFGYAISIGGDPATWTRSQFVRLPDGTRENGKHQSVFYFDPTVK